MILFWPRRHLNGFCLFSSLRFLFSHNFNAMYWAIYWARGSNLSPVGPTHNRLTAKLNIEALKSFSLCVSPLSDRTNQHPAQIKNSAHYRRSPHGAPMHIQVLLHPLTASLKLLPRWRNLIGPTGFLGFLLVLVQTDQSTRSKQNLRIFRMWYLPTDVCVQKTQNKTSTTQLRLHFLVCTKRTCGILNFCTLGTVGLFPFTTLHFKTVDKIFVS